MFATVDGVTSFWAALHQPKRRKLQHAGMVIVPDLFKKPDSGVVIGISGSGDVNCPESMPRLSKILSQETEQSPSVIAHMEIDGTSLDILMSTLQDKETVGEDALTHAISTRAERQGLSAVKAHVDSTNAAVVDEKLSSTLAELKRVAEENGKTVVVHIVYEDHSSETARRRLSRTLEDQVNNKNAQQGGGGGQYGNGFYGYGYWQNGKFVTNYKTMFQIQYFNIVLWTAIGLGAVLFYTIYLMMFMPLEPDTLLFGESAKLPADN